MAHDPDRTTDSPEANNPSHYLRVHNLPSQAFGLHRGRTEALLNWSADTIDRLDHELGKLSAAKQTWDSERKQLEHQLEEARTRAELLLGEAMIDAHKASKALKAEAQADARAIRAEAHALLEPARQEAKRLVVEAELQAKQIVSDADAERARLATESEQYKLLAADLHRRTVDVLQRAIATLETDPADAEVVSDDVRPFRTGRREDADKTSAESER